MKKNTALGLAILAVLVIVAVVLLRLYLSGPPHVGPAPVATSQPAPTPAAQPPAPLVPPGTPPIKVEPSPGVAPLQEPIPPTPKVTILPPQQMKEHYGILVGNYKHYRDAARMLAKLKKQGKPAFVQRDPRNLKRFQVWLGPFSSQAEAQAAEKEMHARLKKHFKIEQIENPVPK